MNHSSLLLPFVVWYATTATTPQSVKLIGDTSNIRYAVDTPTLQHLSIGHVRRGPRYLCTPMPYS